MSVEAPLIYVFYLRLSEEGDESPWVRTTGTSISLSSRGIEVCPSLRLNATEVYDRHTKVWKKEGSVHRNFAEARDTRETRRWSPKALNEEAH
jgi:hypothetical protein